MQKVILVEDVDSLREVLASVLEEQGYSVEAFPDAESSLKAIEQGGHACIITDFKLPKKNGLDLLAHTRDISKNVPFILMTAYGSIDIAVQAMKLGANDFVCKPFEPEYFCKVVKEVIQHKQILDRSTSLRTKRNRSFLTQSPELNEILEQGKKAARVDTSILILGESGTGKELLARAIHEQSPRRDMPFIAVNCAAVPLDLLESEFFGHEAGSFTGATQSRIGVFELASDGTVFLDELGDMPLSLQVKLLRSLQEREIKRVGGTKTIKVNPRIIAATNQNIEEGITSGKIREDFYYRIAVLTLNLPPLRDRPRDIDMLVQHYLEYFSDHFHKPIPKVDDNARALLASYTWPGNARELENVMERAIILAEDVIRKEHLGLDQSQSTVFDVSAGASLVEIASRAAQRAEIDLIRRTLAQTLGNKTKAAQLLGVSYKTLLNKVKEYSLDPHHQA